ncbi:S-formylglutathione hydrolase [Marinicauda pacifica]|jgi:S-formylglutathione hydrolase|uniref:S-formylglutathione hydrolase n=1 Tax=Marinicauda pacifica TaxID=1133559 RepID=UPI0035C78D49
MIEKKSEALCFGGRQQVWTHKSEATATDMTFGLYLPPQAEEGSVPVLVFLSGLTCTHENVITKAGAQHYCAEHGIALLAPDTSPRGLDLPGEHDDYDFGSGAGFYLNATQEPWDAHYHMARYVRGELLDAAEMAAPGLDMDRVSITGHSMGGHGALTLALRHPDRFKSVSAFAPICAPSEVPWGEKAFSRYLGEDRKSWRRYDACALIEDGARVPEILVDQGLADNFLDEQLRPERLEEACRDTGITLTVRRQAGYDHSYYFISTFIGDHIRWAAERLKA